MPALPLLGALFVCAMTDFEKTGAIVSANATAVGKQSNW
jgi:hypothetical protein